MLYVSVNRGVAKGYKSWGINEIFFHTLYFSEDLLLHLSIIFSLILMESRAESWQNVGGGGI